MRKNTFREDYGKALHIGDLVMIDGNFGWTGPVIVLSREGDRYFGVSLDNPTKCIFHRTEAILHKKNPHDAQLVKLMNVLFG